MKTAVTPKPHSQGRGTKTSYEVRVLRGRDWVIDSIFDDHNLAVFEARSLFDSRPVWPVQVVEEKFFEATGQTLSKIVFRSPTKQPPKEVTFRKRAPVPPPPSRMAKPKKKKKPSLVRQLVITILVVGGIGVLALVGLAFLVDQFKG